MKQQMIEQNKQPISSQETKPQKTQRGSFWLGILLFVVVSSAIVAGVEARAYYNRILGLKMSGASTYDVGIIYWSLWAKSLVLLLPVITIATLLVFFRWTKTASLLACAGTAFVLIWLMIDVRLQRFSGGHISNYLEHALNPATWGWSGNLTRIYWQMTWDAIATIAGVTGAYLASKWIVQFFANRFPDFPRRKHLIAAGGFVTAIIAGVFPALQFVDDTLALERLYAALPSNACFFTPENIPYGGTAAFTVQADDEFAKSGKVAHLVSLKVAPVDNRALLSGSNRPNVILVIVESFRRNAMSKKTMPRLAAFAKKGTVLKRHFAASNKSDYGTFALLYGRSPLAYDVTLDAEISKQASTIFENSGYKSSLVASCTFLLGKMDKFMDKNHFDSIQLYHGKQETWWKRDRKTLKEVRRRISTDTDKPQFMVSYLMATHFSYDYPPEYEKNQTGFQPTKHVGMKGRYSLKPKDLLNRYNNSLAFIDDELGQLIESIDLKKNIVIITGDHGESFFEDGHVTHGTTLSDIQTHVPMVIVGAGVPQQEINTPTSHTDLLSSLVHLISGKEKKIVNSHGSSFFSKNHPAQALVIQKYRDSWDVMLVRPDGRLKMNLRRRTPVIRLIGFSNNAGHASRELAHPPKEIPQWKRNLATALENYRISSGKNQTAKTSKRANAIQ